MKKRKFWAEFAKNARSRVAEGVRIRFRSSVRAAQCSVRLQATCGRRDSPRFTMCQAVLEAGRVLSDGSLGAHVSALICGARPECSRGDAPHRSWMGPRWSMDATTRVQRREMAPRRAPAARRAKGTHCIALRGVLWVLRTGAPWRLP